MNIIRLRIAGLALAAIATLTSQAKAQLVSYSQGDLLLGFEQEGTGSNLVVNLGSWTNFLAANQQVNTLSFTGATGAYVNPGVAVEIPRVSLTDLSGTFSDWNNNGQTNLLQWGVIGATTNAGFGLPNRTIFYTVGRENPLVQSTNAPNRRSTAAQNTILTNVNNFGGALSGVLQAGNQYSGLVDATNTNSFSSLDASGFGWSDISIAQADFGSNTGPTNSVLDLYASIQTNGTGGVSAATGGAAPTYLGSFALSDTGVLTFTAAAVPEPSTYMLLGLGLGSLFFLRRRNARQKNLS